MTSQTEVKKHKAVHVNRHMYVALCPRCLSRKERGRTGRYVQVQVRDDFFRLREQHNEFLYGCFVSQNSRIIVQNEAKRYQENGEKVVLHFQSINLLNLRYSFWSCSPTIVLVGFFNLTARSNTNPLRLRHQRAKHSLSRSCIIQVYPLINSRTRLYILDHNLTRF